MRCYALPPTAFVLWFAVAGPALATATPLATFTAPTAAPAPSDAVSDGAAGPDGNSDLYVTTPAIGTPLALVTASAAGTGLLQPNFTPPPPAAAPEPGSIALTGLALLALAAAQRKRD